MLKEFNVKYRATFYLGLLIVVVGLKMLPANVITGAMLSGIISFIGTIIIVIPLLYLYFRFFHKPNSGNSFSNHLLPIVLALGGASLFVLGVFRISSELIDWGTYVVLVAGEAKLADRRVPNKGTPGIA